VYISPVFQAIIVLMSLVTENDVGPNRDSLELLRRIADGQPADDSMKFRVLDQRGNVTPDKPLPEKQVDLNNMWMLLPGGSDRDPTNHMWQSDRTIGQYRLSDWNRNSSPDQEGHSLYLLGLKPAQLFQIVDSILDAAGVNITELKTELAADVERMKRGQPVSVYPHEKYSDVLWPLYRSLRSLGFSHRDLSKRHNPNL
jgi:hypothetical protein